MSTRVYQTIVILMTGLLILAAYGAIQTSSENATRQNQLDACARGDLLRAQVNRIVANVKINQGVLVDFLGSARDARRASGSPNDLRAADAYAEELARLLAAPSFSEVSRPICRDVVR